MNFVFAYILLHCFLADCCRSVCLSFGYGQIPRREQFYEASRTVWLLLIGSAASTSGDWFHCGQWSSAQFPRLRSSAVCSCDSQGNSEVSCLWHTEWTSEWILIRWRPVTPVGKWRQILLLLEAKILLKASQGILPRFAMAFLTRRVADWLPKGWFLCRVLDPEGYETC